MPSACVARRSHGATYCGRSYDTDEFYFQDVDHAVEFYGGKSKTPTTLVACAGCIDMVKKVRIEEGKLQ
jgi:hypothetical protein